MNKKILALMATGAYLAYKTYQRSWRYDLRGKTVLVTGGSRGLGLCLTRQLLVEGCRVVLCARDEQELLRAEHEFLPHYGGRIFTYRCDVSEAGEVVQLVSAIHGRYGPIHVLINNAGVISVGPVELMDRDDYEMSLRAHLWAPLNTIEAVLPEMRQRGEGRIVNISSIGGKIAVPHLLPYCAGKFALVGLSEGLRSELAKDGIVVTTVCPGLMRTGSPRNALFKGQHRLEYTWFTLGDSLPPVAMSADRAAAKIVDALRNGEAEVTLSLLAKAAVTFHGLFPGLTADILGWVNRMLPGPGGIQHERVRGAVSETPITRSWLTALTQAAARRNNEYWPGDNGERSPQSMPELEN